MPFHISLRYAHCQRFSGGSPSLESLCGRAHLSFCLSLVGRIFLSRSVLCLDVLDASHMSYIVTSIIRERDGCTVCTDTG